MPTILFVGTRGEVEESDRNHRYHSSILIDTGRKRVLIDYGEFSPSLDELKPTEIVISHGHIDHVGGLKRVAEEGREDLLGIPIYTTRDVAGKLRKLGFKNVTQIRRGKTFQIDGLKITALSVLHSIRYPAVGFLLEVGGKKIWYGPDFIWLKGYTKKLNGIDIWIGDGSSLTRDLIRRNEQGEIFGHLSVAKQVRLAEKVGAKLFIVTHLGKEGIEMKEDVLRRKLARMSDKVKVILAKDGMKLDLDKLSLEELQITTEDIKELIPKVIRVEEKPKTALYLVEPHARWIWEGIKQAIVKAKKFTKYINKPLYLIGDGLLYGIISLKEPEEITLDEFKQLKSLHLVSEEEREKWWKGKKKLYFYRVEVLKRLPEPIRVELPKGVQVFVSVEKIKVPDDRVELIADWRHYDPKDVSDAVLRDDHRITHMWYNWLMRNPDKKFESEQFKDLTREEQIEVIKELHDRIAKEMVRRGWKHNTPLESELSFKPPESLDMIDPEYLKTLTDDELLELHKWLHEKFREWQEKGEG